jgi:hypothetical protein
MTIKLHVGTTQPNALREALPEHLTVEVRQCSFDDWEVKAGPSIAAEVVITGPVEDAESLIAIAKKVHADRPGVLASMGGYRTQVGTIAYVTDDDYEEHTVASFKTAMEAAA